MLSGIAHQGLDVLGMLGQDNAQGPHFEYAAIRAVQGAAQIIEKQIAFDDTSQVILDSFAFLFVQGRYQNRLAARMQLRLSKSLLAISLGHGKLIRCMSRVNCDAAVMSLAAIADDRVSYP